MSSPDFVNGKHRTYQVKDDPPEACLMIPDGGRHKVTIFYYFPFIFPEPQQMVEDTIRALSQPWDLAFCMYHKHSQKSWSISAFSTGVTCLKQEFVFRQSNVFLLHAMYWSNKVLVFLFYLFYVCPASQTLLLFTSTHCFYSARQVQSDPKRTFWPIHCQCSNHQWQFQVLRNANCHQGRVYIMALSFRFGFISCL